MSPSANHKPGLSMWGMLLTLAHLPPNANNCNVLATIKHSTQSPDIHIHRHVKKTHTSWHTWGNPQTQKLLSDMQWLLEILCIFFRRRCMCECKMSVWKAQDYLRSFSTWSPSIKSAESQKNLMWKHSRGSPAVFTASERGVDASNIVVV